MTPAERFRQLFEAPVAAPRSGGDGHSLTDAYAIIRRQMRSHDPHVAEKATRKLLKLVRSQLQRRRTNGE